MLTWSKDTGLQSRNWSGRRNSKIKGTKEHKGTPYRRNSWPIVCLLLYLLWPAENSEPFCLYLVGSSDVPCWARQLCLEFLMTLRWKQLNYADRQVMFCMMCATLSYHVRLPLVNPECSYEQIKHLVFSYLTITGTRDLKGTTHMKGKTYLKWTIDLKGTTGLTQDRPEVKPTLKEKKNR